MRLLRLAVEKQRWDLAAHAIVLAAVMILNEGDGPDAGKERGKKEVPPGATRTPGSTGSTLRFLTNRSSWILRWLPASRALTMRLPCSGSR
jgi:hypothetical protein